MPIASLRDITKPQTADEMLRRHASPDEERRPTSAQAAIVEYIRPTTVCVMGYLPYFCHAAIFGIN